MPKLDRIPAAARASAPVDRLAREVVKQRVRAVVSYWQKAAQRKSPRVEDIHQLRVWSRRSLAALQLFASVLPPEPMADLAKILNKARKRAGNARDCDVLKRTLDKRARKLLAEFLVVLKQQRQEAADKLRHAYEKKVKSGHLRDCCKAVLKKPSTANNGKVHPQLSFGPWFQSQFDKVTEPFVKQLRVSKPAQRKIHALRIEGKRVRYALEIGLPSLPKTQGKQLYAALEGLQQQLGDVCDDLALAAKYRELAGELKAADRAALRDTSEQHDQQAQAGFAKFARWWQAPTGRKKLLKLLAAVTSPSKNSPTAAKPAQRRKSKLK
ncbi:CHAD domain protein [Anatilimnocola aggregata]|uniref:CHAD domain protein n=1 Tax=Anatilimnocola aggregata TaxID=2528021 RepID=A0A517YER1_9BACT|nr:CHAD domain-containing protein [Anatilimnocola aggregata]QDU28736.1 CHAD domain protein [Anatilimnocola aggregata]